jgi:hypothetical protein
VHRRLAVRGRRQARRVAGRERRCLPLARPRRRMGIAGHSLPAFTTASSSRGRSPRPASSSMCSGSGASGNDIVVVGPGQAHHLSSASSTTGWSTGSTSPPAAPGAFTVKLYVEGQLASTGVGPPRPEPAVNPTSNPFTDRARARHRAVTPCSRCCPPRPCRPAPPPRRPLPLLHHRHDHYRLTAGTRRAPVPRIPRAGAGARSIQFRQAALHAPPGGPSSCFARRPLFMLRRAAPLHASPGRPSRHCW